MRTISVINLKGGVAKTITSANMAHILAVIHNKRVLLVDNDKQGNSSKLFGLHSYERKTVADVMLERNPDLSAIIQKTAYKNLDMITANMNLLKANMETMFDQQRPQQTRFRKALAQVAGEYDYCIIDNAPDINISTINSLVASDDVIIPIKIDQFAFDGLAELIEQINNTREDLNSELNLAGCLITCYQNNEVNRQGEEWLRQSCYPVFKNHIRKTEKIDESTFASRPILDYSSRSGAARDYKRFVEEYVSETSTKEGD